MENFYQFLAFTIVDIATIVFFFRLVKVGNIKALNHVYRIVAEIVSDKVNDAVQPFSIELKTQKELLTAIMNSVQTGGQIDAERLLILEKKIDNIRHTTDNTFLKLSRLNRKFNNDNLRHENNLLRIVEIFNLDVNEFQFRQHKRA